MLKLSKIIDVCNELDMLIVLALLLCFFFLLNKIYTFPYTLYVEYIYNEQSCNDEILKHYVCSVLHC
jgi:hypothetical protein